MLSFQSIREKTPKGFSYWILPLASGITWLITLLTLLIYYYTTSSPHYPSMEKAQTIPYISDVGASTLKPLFITGSILTTFLILLTLIIERFLRHRGRLASNLTQTEKVLAGFSIGFAGVGSLGLVLLSIFDTWRHRNLHNIFLCFFLGGFMLSSVCSCWEYQLLGKHFREYRDLRASFWLKLVFIILEVVFAISFGVTGLLGLSNTAAVIEWVLASGFSFYIFSFIPDLLPAIETKGAAALDKLSDDIEKQDSAQVESPFVSRLVFPRPAVLKE